jgi:hypothetical protein
MLHKYHEEDDIFALKFMPRVGGRPHVEATIPPSPVKEGDLLRLTAPSRNLDERFKVLSVEPIREDSGHFDVVQVESNGLRLDTARPDTAV